MKAGLSLSRVIGRGVRVSLSRQQQQRWISASQLTVDKRVNDKRFDSCPAKEDLVFGTTLSDHMLMVEWDTKTEWGPPKIVPYQDLSISPAASCLHYGKWDSKKLHSLSAEPVTHMG